MRIITTIVLLLLWNSLQLVAQEQWIRTRGDDGDLALCFVLMPDGKLFAFHPEYTLQEREDHTDWDTVFRYTSFGIGRARVNPRGEIIAAPIGRGIWRSSDTGKTWENKSGTGTLSYITIFDIHINEQGYIYAGGPNLFSDGQPIWRSRDNGESWQRIGANLTGDAGTIGVRQNGTMYVCGGKGLYRSNDSGETFSPVEEWGATSSIYGEDIEIHSSGVVIVGSYGEGGIVWRSDEAGEQFFSLDKIRSVGAITMDSTGKIYVFGFSNKDEQHYVFRSLDTGKTWEEYNSGREGANIVNEMITAANGYVYTGGVGIYRTKYRQHNKPVFWGRTQSCNAVEYVVMDSVVTSVQIVPPQSSNVRFEVLSPAGSPKVKIRLSLFDERKPGYFTLRALNAEGMETLYNDTLQKIFPEPVIRQDGDTLWGNGGYVYQWYHNGEKLDSERREFLVPVESGSYSVQVLNAYGCEQRSAEFAYIATSVVEMPTAGQSGRLRSVVPNPGAGEVIITYSVGERSIVRLVIVDALGRELSVVSTGVRDAGEYSVKWDSRNLSSGMYSVRLECGGQVYSLPLVIIK